MGGEDELSDEMRELSRVALKYSKRPDDIEKWVRDMAESSVRDGCAIDAHTRMIDPGVSLAAPGIIVGFEDPGL